MSKAAAIAISLAVIFVQICCTPSLQAAVPQETLYCPITGVQCEARDVEECDGEPPQLAAPVAPHAIATELVVIADVLVLPLPHADREPVVAFWSAPTRTIQLRI